MDVWLLDDIRRDFDLTDLWHQYCFLRTTLRSALGSACGAASPASCPTRSAF